MSVVLASTSPRRIDLLRAAGIAVDVVPVDVDESLQADESPERYVERVAGLKAASGLALRPDATVIGADTTVVVDGEVFGKPADAADAARMLRRLGGRDHQVMTGVAILAGGRRATFVESTTVWFASLTEADIAWYISTGEPMGKAGAYALQGAASRFIPRIEGSHANVIGLPVARVWSELAQLESA